MRAYTGWWHQGLPRAALVVVVPERGPGAAACPFGLGPEFLYCYNSSVVLSARRGSSLLVRGSGRPVANYAMPVARSTGPRSPRRGGKNG